MSDLLTEDPEIPGQKWVLISFLSPERIKDVSQRIRGLKIRGVYSTQEDAEKASKLLRERDPYFNIYVGSVGRWLPWDDAEKTEEENYAEKELNDLMRAYRQQQIMSKQEFEQRKEDEVQNAIEHNNEKNVKA